MKISRWYATLQLIVIYFVCSECNLVEFYRWKQVTYEGLPSDKVDGNSSNSFLNVYNIVPRGVTHYNGRLFITVPRTAPGIPSTLNYVPDDLPIGSSPALRPYPDLKTNELHLEHRADENRIVSVFRTRVDDCGRLWFVDTGHIQETGQPMKQIQQPSVWVIDLNTDKVVRRFEIPTSVSEIGRGKISLKVDVDKSNCDRAFAYIPDLFQQRLYVYSLESNRMWTFTHPYLDYELELTKYNVTGFQFQWKDAVFSITLGRRGADGYRQAYFHPMASNSEFAVSTKVLQNETASTNIDFHLSDFVVRNRPPYGRHIFYVTTLRLVASQVGLHTLPTVFGVFISS
ncbi:L-dopachrome tautomerase yellow-f-like [Bradysia coprophila]|uniref:L-dopachrome tautomerase yellow-f-like n=1 Tax=Bradysia coprophila TaxID=38358 RepID=UPI00187DAFE9|nr:L-dopachrome tautomerase yellow-f-like [Bradysia coprophila]